jgi:hypothetical protein
MKESPDNHLNNKLNYEYDKYSPVRYNRHERRQMQAEMRKLQKKQK